MASLLIGAEARPLLTAFYRYARSADDVADDPALCTADKLARLDLYAAGLDGDADGESAALALRRVLLAAGHGGAVLHARALLGAFRQDARRGRLATWDDLMAYCRMSADPVGRFILDVHGEPAETHAPADALCSALQVLNHLQDLGHDYRAIDRVYLPMDWIEGEGGRVPDLGREALSPALRRAVDRALARTGDLLDRAGALPRRLASRRLAGEVTSILALARGLHRRLSTGDPLGARIAPSRLDFLRAGACGLGEIGRRALPRAARPSAGERA